MIGRILSKVIGTKQKRSIKKLLPLVGATNAWERKTSKLSDKALQGKTDEFRGKIKPLISRIDSLRREISELSDIEQEGARVSLQEKRKQLDDLMYDLLPEAFSVVREAAKRTIGLRSYDEQLMGGMILHRGGIAEMANGEGKTLVATLPVYLNALEGKGVHVITVNDYLAKRDRDWMGPVYEFLGLTVGVIQNKLDSTSRKKAYECDITYGTNNEFGFDYLRDNMALRMEDKVQRGHHYAIVDEVDSILIDEARTPLIISGPAEKSTELYGKIDKLVPLLKGRETVEEREEEDKDTDYVWNPKDQTVALTEKGVKRVEKRLRAERLLETENLYQDGLDLATHVNQALRAHRLFEKDRDYLVKDGEVVIIDEFTGRLMPGRRWSDGLHQAVEAKEGVMIRNENQTLATITLQNYFRMYDKLAGMTGTAATESDEFLKIYNLEVVSIPTHKPTIRENVPDRIYQTEKTKFEAVIKEVEKLHQEGSPVLVGTRSVEKSEALSRSLREKGVPHTVLNAKYHEKEAQIVAQAGEKRAVTIATNMAGRGTDIKLGEGVEDLGGLFVIGTERHESRRIDNQLRGRSGRQGAPGTSQLYVSLEDELMRLFGSERIARIMQRLKIPEDQPIEHPWVTKALERAQEQVERRNFDIRKHLLEYDDVMNKQREVIYRERDKVLRGENLKEDILEMMENVIDALLSEYADEKIRPEDWDRRNLLAKVKYHFSTEIPYSSLSEVYDRKELQQIILEAAKKSYQQKEKRLGDELIRGLERMAFLHTMDSGWKDHLYTMDILKEGIGLRGYGQHDPLIEYKREAYSMFEDLIQRIRQGVVEFIFKVEVSREPVFERILVGSPETPEPVLIASDRQTGEVHSPQPRSPYQRRTKKVGRNEPCPCGSGKKYKYCHGG